MIPDRELLRCYAEAQDETAFGELVQRHLPVVHAAALRLTGGNFPAAQDVAQAVFTNLAHHARALTDHPTLIGWLHTTTRNLAHKTMRAERRRRIREQEAAAMHEQIAAPKINVESWQPLLDEAVGRLREDERNILLLRFFQGKSHREVGAILGVGENTVNKRLIRALEKLRKNFARRDVATTVALLAVAMEAQAAQPLPALLTAQVAAASLAKASAAGGITHFFWNILIMSTKTKIITAAAAVAVLASIPLVIQHRQINQLKGDRAQSPAEPAPRRAPARSGDAQAADNLAALRNILALKDSLQLMQRLTDFIRNLSAAEIKPLLDYLVQTADIQRSSNLHAKSNQLALSLLIGRLVHFNPADALQWAQAVPNRLGRTELTSEVFAAWATTNPDRALAAAGQISDQRLKETVLGQIIQILISRNPTDALAVLQSLPLNHNYSTIIAQTFATWAGEDPRAAIAAAMNLPATRGRSMAVQSALQGWTALDPQAVLTWAGALPEGLTRNQAVKLAVSALSRQDPLEALQYVGGLSNILTRNSMTVKVAADWAQDDPKAALDWIQQNTNGATQRQAMMVILDPMSKIDPQAAVELFTKLPSGGGTGATAAERIALNWAEVDAPATLKWLKYLNDATGTGPVSAVKSGLESKAISIWAKNDPDAALAYVVALGPDDSQFSPLIATIAVTRADLDPSSATAWLQSLPDEVTRSAALASVVTQLTSNDPEQALHLAQQMPAGPAQDAAYGKIITVWSATDPAVAAESLASLPAGAALTSATQSVAANWIQADPSAAGKWVNSLPAGEARDVAAREEARALTGMDSAAAFHWAASIDDPTMKAAQVRSIIQVWGRADPAAATAAIQSATTITELARTRMLALIQRNGPAQDEPPAP